MRGQSPLIRVAAGLRAQSRRSILSRQCRAIQISASPATESQQVGADAFGLSASSRDPADARFEVLGSPYSLLSVTLSASQKLYTRRGTLVAVAGNPENAQSTLSILSPFTRAFFGVPFLYQRISSTTPLTALISTKSPTTTFSVLHLDGTTDWIISQRNALLAWTGHTLSPTPRLQRHLSAAHWGTTHVTGRGLVALTSPGQVYRLTLSEGEEFIAHPSNVVAYTVTRTPPQPFRFKSSVFRLQIPSLPRGIANAEFFRVMRTTDTYKTLARLFYNVRTSLRRTIWGDRLFLRFQGPATLLMSSRGVRLADSLTNEDVNEIADAEAGKAAEVVNKLKREAVKAEEKAKETVLVRKAPDAVDGKVTLEGLRRLKDTMQ
ncbi:Altered inheritance of mitochondria protein 24, mitochondrial [Scedosporium apiospermum]|uniref:Altered inheritance of mitochondria protein 24, mitochondrial n=1 Tax=Pseudallescheria apiosperma TaxID=563466 RepID=A0A084G875_PSEDA|nr:Altered inheritance of mitochondria protein 24, mitochondrial [Scedosporium apiospermum]KEZ43537.1 Altered inheritance of mitochondria protein 24, mitochondrial [Scedosporium apiospermum]